MTLNMKRKQIVMSRDTIGPTLQSTRHHRLHQTVYYMDCPLWLTHLDVYAKDSPPYQPITTSDIASEGLEITSPLQCVHVTNMNFQ